MSTFRSFLKPLPNTYNKAKNLIQDVNRSATKPLLDIELQLIAHMALVMRSEEPRAHMG